MIIYISACDGGCRWQDRRQAGDGRAALFGLPQLPVHSANQRLGITLAGDSTLGTHRSMLITPVLQNTHTFNGPFSCTTWVGPRKVKRIWILLKQQTVSGSGISWAICKSASCSRQINMPAPHHSVFTGWMPFLPPNQQRQSTEGVTCATKAV